MVLSAAQYKRPTTGPRQFLGHCPLGRNISIGPLRSKASVSGEIRHAALISAPYPGEFSKF
jgi:hypothetical protein